MLRYEYISSDTISDNNGGGDVMKIVRKSTDKYGLQKEGKTYRIIKILKEYDNEQDAAKDLAKLLTGEITEDELTEDDEILY